MQQSKIYEIQHKMICKLLVQSYLIKSRNNAINLKLCRTKCRNQLNYRSGTSFIVCSCRPVSHSVNQDMYIRLMHKQNFNSFFAISYCFLSFHRFHPYSLLYHIHPVLCIVTSSPVENCWQTVTFFCLIIIVTILSIRFVVNLSG